MCPMSVDRHTHWLTLTADNFNAETRMTIPVKRVKLYEACEYRLIQVDVFQPIRVWITFEHLSHMNIIAYMQLLILSLGSLLCDVHIFTLLPNNSKLTYEYTCTLMYVHSHTHTHTLTYTHTHTHTHTHTYTHTHTHTHTHTRLHTHTHTHIHTHTHTHTHTHLHTYTHTHIHAHSHIHTYTHTHTLTHSFTHNYLNKVSSPLESFKKVKTEA